MKHAWSDLVIEIIKGGKVATLKIEPRICYGPQNTYDERGLLIEKITTYDPDYVEQYVICGRARFTHDSKEVRCLEKSVNTKTISYRRFRKLPICPYNIPGYFKEESNN